MTSGLGLGSSLTMHRCAGSHTLDQERRTDQRRSNSGDIPQESKQALGNLKDKSGPMCGFHRCCVCCSTDSPGFCCIFSVSALRRQQPHNQLAHLITLSPHIILQAPPAPRPRAPAFWRITTPASGGGAASSPQDAGELFWLPVTNHSSRG